MSTLNGGPGNIVTNGLVLYLDAANYLSYTSGSTTWNDLSGNNNTGSLVNGPTFSSTNAGSIVLDGADDYVGLGNNSSLQFGTGSFTLNVWINPANTSSASVILVKRQTVNPFNMVTIRVGTLSVFGGGFTASPSKKICFALWSGPVGFTPNGGVVANTTNDIIDGNWKNITLTRTSGSIVLYVNAVSQSVSIVYDFGTRTLADVSVTGSNWAAGAVPEIPAAFISGSYSGIQMYNRALTASEVLQNYNATKARFGL
jgi:hypothetical protein